MTLEHCSPREPPGNPLLCPTSPNVTSLACASPIGPSHLFLTDLQDPTPQSPGTDSGSETPVVVLPPPPPPAVSSTRMRPPCTHARTHTPHCLLLSLFSFQRDPLSSQLSKDTEHYTTPPPPLPLTCNPTHLLPPLLLLCLSYCAQFHTEWIRDLTRLVSLQHWCGDKRRSTSSTIQPTTVAT